MKIRPAKLVETISCIQNKSDKNILLEEMLYLYVEESPRLYKTHGSSISIICESESKDILPPTGNTVFGQLWPKSFVFMIGKFMSDVTSSKIDSILRRKASFL